MSEFFDPYNADRPLMMKCSCGRDHTLADHHAEANADAAAATLRARSDTAEFEAYSNEFIEATLVKALFPQDAVRRRFLRAVGKGTAMAAISSVLPGQHAGHGAGQKCAGKDQPEDRLHPHHLRHATDHGAPPGLLQQAGPER
jgi:hypothetical protein